VSKDPYSVNDSPFFRFYFHQTITGGPGSEGCFKVNIYTPSKAKAGNAGAITSTVWRQSDSSSTLTSSWGFLDQVQASRTPSTTSEDTYASDVWSSQDENLRTITGDASIRCSVCNTTAYPTLDLKRFYPDHCGWCREGLGPTNGLPPSLAPL
jgi:hypothetical protein